MDLKRLIDILETIGKVLGGIAAVIGAITAVLAAVSAFLGKFADFREKVLDPLWRKVLRPFLLLVITLASLMMPIGGITWGFMYWVAEYLVQGIKEPDIFLFVVAWSTVAVSVYALFWGMWLYPTQIRPWLKNLSQDRVSQDQGPIDSG